MPFNCVFAKRLWKANTFFQPLNCTVYNTLAYGHITKTGTALMTHMSGRSTIMDFTSASLPEVTGFSLIFHNSHRRYASSVDPYPEYVQHPEVCDLDLGVWRQTETYTGGRNLIGFEGKPTIGIPCNNQTTPPCGCFAEALLSVDGEASIIQKTHGCWVNFSELSFFQRLLFVQLMQRLSSRDPFSDTPCHPCSLVGPGLRVARGQSRPWKSPPRLGCDFC